MRAIGVFCIIARISMPRMVYLSLHVHFWVLVHSHFVPLVMVYSDMWLCSVSRACILALLRVFLCGNEQVTILTYIYSFKCALCVMCVDWRKNMCSHALGLIYVLACTWSHVLTCIHTASCACVGVNEGKICVKWFESCEWRIDKTRNGGQDGFKWRDKTRLATSTSLHWLHLVS